MKSNNPLVWCEAAQTPLAALATAKTRTNRQNTIARAVLVLAALAGGAPAAQAALFVDTSVDSPGNDINPYAGGQGAIALGIGAKAGGPYAVATGFQASAQGSLSIANGVQANAQGDKSTAMGAQAITATTAIYGIAIGNQALVSGLGAMALGASARAANVNSVAIGYAAAATAANSVALGAGSITAVGAQTGYHAYGLTTPQTSAGEINVGDRTITGVAAGAADTDAVNAGQLKGAITAATANAVAYGNNANGTVNTGSVTLAGPTSMDGGVTDGTTITNVHQGAISASSTDAVNGAQLYAIAGDSSTVYIKQNGSGIKYLRTNDDSLTPDDARATAPGASAIGYNARADGENSVALGRGAHSETAGAAAVAIGYDSEAAATGAVATGYQASASAANAIAVGHGASASSVNGVAVGNAARANGTNAVALGAGARARQNGTALGRLATAYGSNASALGYGSLAYADGSTALGANARVSGADSVALGYNVTVTAANSVGVGANSTTTANLSQPGEEFGTSGVVKATHALGEVSVGSTGNERRLTNVAAGTAATDAVNLSQLRAVDGKLDAIAQSGTQHYFKAEGAADGTDDAGAAGTHAVASGVLAAASGDNATALGANSAAAATGAAALGAYASATSAGSIAIGYGAVANHVDSIAIGHDANASADGSVALGQGSVANRANTVSVGSAGNERQISNVAAGTADTDAVNVAQLKAVSDQGAANAARLDGALMYGQKADGSVNRNSVTLGGDAASGGTLIHNVAAGVDATDAVNVAQLKAVSDQGAANAARLDGAVMYDQNADGSVNRNSVTLGGDAASGGTLIHNVAAGVDATDAVNVAQLNAAIGGAISNVVVNTANPFFSAEGGRDTEGAVSSGTHSVAAGANAKATGANATAIGANSRASGENATSLGANSVASGANATALGATANASADNAVALGQGSMADRANTVSVGAAGQERQITNVAAGVQGTDAVNVNQLQQSVGAAVSQASSYTDDQIRSARRDSYGGTASAMAMAGLPQAVLPGRGMVAMAGGTYAGQSALAIGVSQLSETGTWVYKVQGTTDSRGQFGASIGAGMHW
ncbi:YadA-like family protein [Paraburkholderia sp. FT54]|nr:YadA-like family protein [Paraburkholderia sp. FT54]WNC91092.1 YadA-like family protein [Paraburkholderia sp. FT54]